MSIRYIENSIEDMIPIIFYNPSNRSIDMCLEGLEDQYDIFCFATDLLTKGILLLYGVNNKVELENISKEQFDFVALQMKKAGIVIYMDIINTPSNKDVGIFFPKNTNSVNLSDYFLILNSKHCKYKISYKLERYISSN